MATKRPAHLEQLQEFKKEHPEGLGIVTTSSGNPLANVDASLTVGVNGPILLEDWPLLNIISHFNRERIPERAAHAKGGGAFGYFEVTHDITQYTAAKLFSKIGKKTPVGVRFSTVSGSLGSADTVRELRGMSVKFYTEDGILDFAGNNSPIFFIRDPIHFNNFTHCQKGNPVTNTRDWDMYWDFMSSRPETTHALMFVFSDRGLPDGYRFMHGFAGHTYEVNTNDQKRSFVKIHFRTNQGIKNLTVQRAAELAGIDPDYANKDLYNAIHDEKFPSWTLYIQTMTLEESAKLKFNPFDVTKIWPQGDFPLKPVGQLTLNRNPSNFFAEMEQIVFNPGSLVPGIRASPDRILHGRIFAYHDAQLYRVGANHNQLPVNSPFRAKNFQRDGKATLNNQGGAPVYHPNSFGGPNSDARADRLSPRYKLSGEVGRYDTTGDDNFSQARDLYRKVMNDAERERLTNNIVNALKFTTDTLQKRAVANFSQVDETLGANLTIGLKNKLNAAL